MPRAFVKGEPDAKVREWYDVTREAYEAALEAIEPGVTGEAVNDVVCDVFERGTGGVRLEDLVVVTETG